MNRCEKCPICGQAAIFNVGFIANRDSIGYGGDCDRCGKVRITEEVVTNFRQHGTLHLLSAFFRRYPMGPPPLVTLENVGELIAGMAVWRTVSEKMDGLLKLLVESKTPPGTPLTFDPMRDYPLVFAANWQEASFLLGQLRLRRLIDLVTGSNMLQVTADGYERIEQLEAGSHKSARNVFVAMWFDKSRDFVYNEAIEPAIREAGYQAIRIDRTEHVNRIDDEIVTQLRQSRYLVADFTGQRPGVYYEAGFMHGLGRNVIWMIDKEELGQVHFDVRQYNFIDYGTSPEAKARLYYRIMAVEGKGPGPTWEARAVQD